MHKRGKKKKIPVHFYHLYRKDRKGLSEVVTNLLIILLVLVAVGVVWVVIRNILAGGAGNIELGQFTFDLRIQSAYVSGTDIVVGVKRNPGGGELIGMKFLFTNSTEILVVRRNVALEELEERIFTFNSTEISGISAGDEVSIAPIYSSSGTEKAGNPTDTAIISGNLPPGEGSGPVCGNFICEVEESVSCPADCSDAGGFCSDGNVGPGEQCDDGGTVPGDGCSATCIIETPSSCNLNGVIDSGEFCDDPELGGETCQTQGFDGGPLLCNNCGFDTSQCTTTAGFCGDGAIDAGEQCDGSSNLGGQSCITLGFVGGQLDCSSSCQYDTSQCTNPAPPSCDGAWQGNSEDFGVECDGTPLPNGCSALCVCEPGFTANGAGGCALNPPLNTGIINSTWINIFFNSNNLPKSSAVNGYIGNYANFSNSAETGCFLITFADYLDGNNISYVRLDYSLGYPDINFGEGYSVWEAVNCGQ
ncbi:MAG: hypothetical protein AABX50_01470 [Nanoarchaeota archaeon]